jgi:hypothetical protein
LMHFMSLHKFILCSCVLLDLIIAYRGRTMFKYEFESKEYRKAKGFEKKEIFSRPSGPKPMLFFEAGQAWLSFPHLTCSLS